MKSAGSHPRTAQVENLVQVGIDAARAGQKLWARELLTRAVELDPGCVPAWLWLSEVAEAPEEKERCLENVLDLDPDHEMARLGLAWLRAEQEPAVPAQAEPQAVAAPEPVMELALAAEGPTPGPEAGLDRSASAPLGLEDLLQAGINAASARQAEQARDLLWRVIEVDERNMAAWLWLSYVADSHEERDRYVGKVISLALPDEASEPFPGAAVPESDAAQQGWGTPAYALGTASATTILTRPAPAASFSQSLALQVASAYVGLQTAIGQWVSAWALTAQAYLAGIALAELLVTFGDPQVGLVAHGLLLVALLLHAARVRIRAQRAFLVSLAFAPLIRLLSLSLPLGQVPTLYWYAITSLPLFAALFVAARTLGFSWSDLGLNFRQWPLQLGLGLSGIVFGTAEYYILRPDPLATALEWSALWRPALILVVCTGLLEEMIFRGLLQRTADDVLGRWGLIYAALVFAVLHIGYRLFVDVIFVLFVGLFFAWAVRRTRSLLGVTLSHGLTNVVLFLVMPFLHG